MAFVRINPLRDKRLRKEAPDFNQRLQSVLEQIERHGPHHHLFTWQSSFILTTGLGIRFYTTHEGSLVWCRLDRSTGDGASTATADVLLNGTTIYPSASKPSLAAATNLGPERIPDVKSFKKGDYFQINILATGGGRGPLRVSFHLG